MRVRLAFAALLVAAPLQAQGLGEQCAGGPGGSTRELCFRVAEAVEVLQPRVGISFSGGNPVPGTASTLGMRLGTMPRISIGARFSAAAVEIGGIERLTDAGEQSFAIPSFNVDGSVGLFSGVSLGPTIGGFGSIDLLASFGHVPLPEGEGFAGSVNSWAAGARVGFLRESFTAPGLSLSGMYRSVGGVEYGDPELEGEQSHFEIEDLGIWSARAAVSKRLLGFGLTGGVGYDWYSGGASLRIADGSGNAFELSDDAIESSRMTLFGNASLTLLILHLVGEIGWQNGGDANAAPQLDRIEKAGFYGGLSLRLSL
jgi:hypothetical protein